MSPRPRARAAAVGLAAVLVVGGCGHAPDLAAERAHALQQSVLAVSQAAAQGDWAQASTALDRTRTQLEAGADAGEVSSARYRQVDAALDDVEQQVAAAQAAAQAAAEQAAADQAAAEQAAAEQAAAEQAAADQAAAEQAAATSAGAGPAPGDGKGTGPGTGKGKDKGKGKKPKP